MALWSFLSFKKHDVPAVFVHHQTETSEKALSFLKDNFPKSPLTVLEIPRYDESLGLSRESYWSNQRMIALRNSGLQVMTAHHLDDVVESHIMASLKNRKLSIFPTLQRVGPMTWKPLLGTKKEALISYLSRHQIPYIEDETNSVMPDGSYDNMRAYIRANLNVFLTVNPGLYRTAMRIVREAYLSHENCQSLPNPIKHA